MVAPLLLAAAPALAEVAKSKSTALSNDIVVVKWHRPGTITGKGKARRVTADRDVELHVNPVSIGVGAGVLAVGALAAGVAAYSLGVGVQRGVGRDVDRQAINHFDLVDERWVYQKTEIRSGRGRPLRSTTTQVYPNVPRGVMTDVEMLDAYVVVHSRVRNQYAGTKRQEIITQRMRSPAKGRWQIYDRPRNSFIKVG